jgi:tRNA threonylcarbamoyl adenosine modification protein YjeE
MIEETVYVESVEDTKLFATRLATTFVGGSVIGLSGDLGAGKTTLVRYLVEALGGSADDVSSPSYTLEYQYSLASGLLIEHWDLYRVSELPDELMEAPSDTTIRLIEWPEQCQWYEGAIDRHIQMVVKEDDGICVRQITISCKEFGQI